MPSVPDLLTKHRALVQISIDRELTRIDVAVGALLIEHINHQTGDAWPSVVYMARNIECSREAIYKSLRRLCTREYFFKQSGGGRGRSNRYRLNEKRVNRSSLFSQGAAVRKSVIDCSQKDELETHQTVNVGSGETTDEHTNEATEEGACYGPHPSVSHFYIDGLFHHKLFQDEEKEKDFDKYEWGCAAMLLERFAEMCCPPLPVPMKLTANRKEKLLGNLRTFLDGDFRAWAPFCDHVSKSDFLCGRLPPRGGYSKPFLADIDWILEEDNFVRIIEGVYHLPGLRVTESR